ncbi:FAR1-related protein [Corchorus olitorius]|uniref:Protein FAR1-RELATED SEQUENCE n=1 Tax=Corchorus olitorius TaxID=93759 RepID=A0A1R3GRN6_9ROSI|nr:FAR1-related protein [Corchorus olitorius]
MEGILCSHALKVLDLMNIKLIPDRYILKRWTKHARDGNVQDFDGHDVEEKLGMKHGEICQQSLLELEGVDKENHLEIFAPIKAKGLKKKDSCKGRPRLKSWTEKLSTKKNKGLNKKPCKGKKKGDPMQHSSNSRNVSSHSQTYQELDKENMGHLDAQNSIPFAVDSQIRLPTSFINPYEGISMPDYRAWTHDESQVISHPNFSEMLMEAMTPNSYGGFDVPSQFLDQNRLNEEQDDLLSEVGILGDVSNASNMKSH